MVLMFIFTSDRTGTGITFPLEKTFFKILIIYMEQRFSDTRHQAVQGIGSWEKENKWVLWLPQLMPGERIQVAAQGESTRAEPRGLPELRKKTWESREAKGGEAHRAEYSRGVSYTERKRSNLRRVPCETEAESAPVCTGGNYWGWRKNHLKEAQGAIMEVHTKQWIVCVPASQGRNLWKFKGL